MSEDIRIKKGLSINIKGVADKELKKVPLPKQLALILDDFHLVIPKLILREGDSVKRGQPIFYSKANEKIKFTSPASGIIEKIERGDRRKILQILIKTNKNDFSIKHKVPSFEKLNSKVSQEFTTELNASVSTDCVGSLEFSILSLMGKPVGALFPCTYTSMYILLFSVVTGMFVANPASVPIVTPAQLSAALLFSTLA